jgi:hypothetical protein
MPCPARRVSPAVLFSPCPCPTDRSLCVSPVGQSCRSPARLMLASSADEQEPRFDVIPKTRSTTIADDHCFKAGECCDPAKRGGLTAGGCFRQKIAARTLPHSLPCVIGRRRPMLLTSRARCMPRIGRA